MPGRAGNSAFISKSAKVSGATNADDPPPAPA
jgi:hypothetical protein